MPNVEHKATDFFGDSMQLQTSPILLSWNWNHFWVKQVQKLHRIA